VVCSIRFTKHFCPSHLFCSRSLKFGSPTIQLVLHLFERPLLLFLPPPPSPMCLSSPLSLLRRCLSQAVLQLKALLFGRLLPLLPVSLPHYPLFCNPPVLSPSFQYQTFSPPLPAQVVLLPSGSHLVVYDFVRLHCLLRECSCFYGTCPIKATYTRLQHGMLFNLSGSCTDELPQMSNQGSLRIMGMRNARRATRSASSTLQLFN
jgi:hypothetical protein